MPPKQHAVSPIAAQSKFLGLSMEPQEKTNWCWAAVSVSVRRFRKLTELTQCQEANLLLGRNNCCANPEACNLVGRLDRNVLFEQDGAAMAFEDVRVEIDKGRPVAVEIEWTDGGGHFVCIDGYNAAGATPLLSVKDPLNGSSMVPYPTFVSSYLGLGKWKKSFRS